MQIKELIEKAKNGDEKAFNLLVEHYEDSFCDMVVRKNNDEGLRKTAKEELPEILREYLKHSYTKPLHDHLSYYSISYFADKLRLYDTRDMDINKLKEIYTKRLLKLFKAFNKVLTEDELYKYTYKLISEVIDNFSNDREILANRLGIFISRQKRFVKTEDALLIRYTLQEGYNDNIIDYFDKKYKFLLEEYKEEISYIHLCENFRNMVIEVLNEIDCNKKTFVVAIKKKIQKKHMDYTYDIRDVGLNIRSNDERKTELYEANLILKDKVYKYYIKRVNLTGIELREIIDENYDSYFNAYVNGKCTKPFRQYILTRFNEHFSKTRFTKKLTSEEKEKRELTYLENQDFIDKKMKKLSMNCPSEIIRKELLESYEETIDDYFRKENKSGVRELISYRLNKKLKELNLLYSDAAINESSSKLKRAIILNKLQNEEIVNEIIDNLTKYYISNKMENTKLFEQVIIDVVENFDMEEYLMIKEIKEHINLKVLRRPKIK